MKNSVRRLLGGGVVFLGVNSLAALSAWSGTTVSNELIVRYRDSAQTRMEDSLQAASALGAQGEVLNSDARVARLRFDSAEAAEKAAMKLELSGDVESVSANHLYQPAVHYTVRDSVAGISAARGAARNANAHRFVTPLEILAASLPALQPAPALVPGVDPLDSQDWAIKAVNLPAAVATSGKPVITAVIDTGIDYNHEDLGGALWRKGGSVGYDYAHDNDQPYDIVHFDIEGCLKDFGCGMGFNQGEYLTNPGHGTHCAGHVGAVANNSKGIRGVGAGAAEVMGLKFFFDSGEANAGSGDDAAAIKSIDYAIKNGAKVISASWGGRMKRESAERSELKQALVRAQKAGVIVVIAAGNDPVDNDTVANPSYPAAYDLDNLIVVAASDAKDQLASFSAYGVKSVHIAAPGVRVLSTVAAGSYAGAKYSDIVAKFKNSSGKEQELAWDGTSMATPIVAGAVALVWSRHPGESYQQIRGRILNNARKVGALSGKVASGGVLDVAAALKD